MTEEEPVTGQVLLPTSREGCSLCSVTLGAVRAVGALCGWEAWAGGPVGAQEAKLLAPRLESTLTRMEAQKHSSPAW